MPRVQTSESTIKIHEKQDRALELRLAGYSLEQVAKAVGYGTPSGAHGAIAQALKRQPPSPADELRELESKRMDRLIRALWTRAMRGDLQAIDRILHIMVRRARLLGLDRPPAPIDVNVIITDYAERMAKETGLDAQELIRLATQYVTGKT